LKLGMDKQDQNLEILLEAQEKSATEIIYKSE
jgi:hypothetical protein